MRGLSNSGAEEVDRSPGWRALHLNCHGGTPPAVRSTLISGTATVSPMDQRTRRAAHTDDTAPGWEGGPKVKRACEGEETQAAPRIVGIEGKAHRPVSHPGQVIWSSKDGDHVMPRRTCNERS